MIFIIDLFVLSSNVVAIKGQLPMYLLRLMNFLYPRFDNVVLPVDISMLCFSFSTQKGLLTCVTVFCLLLCCKLGLQIDLLRDPDNVF